MRNTKNTIITCCGHGSNIKFYLHPNSPLEGYILLFYIKRGDKKLYSHLNCIYCAILLTLSSIPDTYFCKSKSREDENMNNEIEQIFITQNDKLTRRT